MPISSLLFLRMGYWRQMPVGLSFARCRLIAILAFRRTSVLACLAILLLASMAPSMGCSRTENPAATAHERGESSPTSDQPSSPRAIENVVEDRSVEGVREIPIPRREHGYKHFESAVIANDEALGDFLKLVAAQPNWNNKEAFVNSLKSAKIDFSTSALLLIRNTAGSGSIKVSLAPPVRKGDDILFHVTWDVPGILTMDMAYYCFAVTIPRGTAESVRILSPERPELVLPLRN
jgi:hypothetical protein